jgi:hypothetical protein
MKEFFLKNSHEKGYFLEILKNLFFRWGLKKYVNRGGQRGMILWECIAFQNNKKGRVPIKTGLAFKG